MVRFTDVTFKLINSTQPNGFGAIEIRFENDRDRDIFLWGVKPTTIIFDDEENGSLFIDYSAYGYEGEPLALIKLPLMPTPTNPVIPEVVKQSVIFKLQQHYQFSWDYRKTIPTESIVGDSALNYESRLVKRVSPIQPIVTRDSVRKQNNENALSQRVQKLFVNIRSKPYSHPMVLSMLGIGLTLTSHYFGLKWVQAGLIGSISSAGIWVGRKMRNKLYRIYEQQAEFVEHPSVKQKEAYDDGYKAASNLPDYLFSWVKPLDWSYLDRFGQGFRTKVLEDKAHNAHRNRKRR
jgi:hypothetical protein